MFETGKTVIRIAQDCGFQSPASFSQAFTKHFGCAPSQWRKSGYQTYMHRVQMQQQSGWMGKVDALTLPDIAIQQCAEQRIAYVRHLGYDRSICNAWQYLRAWAYTVGIDWQAEQMIGLHHSNPDIIPLAECRYVAGITTNQTNLKHGAIGLLKIPVSSYAVMRVTGQLGDLLPMIHTFYHQWLPGSGYNLGSTLVTHATKRINFSTTTNNLIWIFVYRFQCFKCENPCHQHLNRFFPAFAKMCSRPH